ncbi:MAG TPA: NapC/NirT family cytochrome c [Methylomirabilota bacterium]|nr:NapC/NirT family cytochrome c [Methylomirabilota bacterium]
MTPSGVPLPHGWIGTTSQWVQGFGIAFAVLSVVLLLLTWRRLRRAGAPSGSWGWLLVAVGLVPLVVAFTTFAHGLEGSTTVKACGSCHVMTPFIADLQDVKSETLAAKHYKNRYIRENQCYTCHSDYGLGGTVKAKLAGLGHVYRYTTGRYPMPIKIAEPYPNVRCLGCHGESQKFLSSPSKQGIIPDLMSGDVSCLTCHAPVHPDPATRTLR